MKNYQNIIEYYDELYPVTQDQKDFFSSLLKEYPVPSKFLGIECATGLFEYQLAKDGLDVTGIDSSPELLHSANLRRRSQLMSVRFFEMSYIDISRFLGKGFYNVISCLNDKIIFIQDTTLLKKFLYDCKELLAPGGTLILEFSNFNTSPGQLPVRESIRVKLFSELYSDETNTVRMEQNIETGNGKLLPVLERHAIRPLYTDELETFAKNAGFNSIEFYSNYKKEPLSEQSPKVVALLK